MSNARDVKRARSQLAEELVEAGIEIAAARQAQHDAEQRLLQARAEIKNLQGGVTELRAAVASERLQRVSAQRGLVNYMRRMGLADRIGYDPDDDPTVKEDIAAGKLPPRNDPGVIKEIAATVLAAKVAV